MKLMDIGLAAIMFALSGATSAANRPAGYITICNEGQTCSVAVSTKVAFGRADKFFYRQLTGSFACSEATFGGKVAGGKNECSVPAASSSASSRSSSSRSASSTSSASSSRSSSSRSSANTSSSSASSSVQPPVGAGYTFCAQPGKICSFTGTRMVYLWDCAPDGLCVGSGAKFTGQMLCDMSSYGGGTIGTHPVGCWAGPDITPPPPPPPGSLPGNMTGSTCVSTGTVTVTAPIVISSGTYDGGCKTYVGFGLDDDEVRRPVFRVENGATLKNAIIGIACLCRRHGR